jgi:hypothetical protein
MEQAGGTVPTLKNGLRKQIVLRLAGTVRKSLLDFKYVYLRNEYVEEKMKLTGTTSLTR